MDSSASAVSAGESLSLEKVATAWKVLRPALWSSPLLRCPALSDMADIEILIETEDERHGQEVFKELAQEAKAHNFELLLETPGPEKPRP